MASAGTSERSTACERQDPLAVPKTIRTVDGRRFRLMPYERRAALKA
jgi:hypothetical protein